MAGLVLLKVILLLYLEEPEGKASNGKLLTQQMHLAETGTVAGEARRANKKVCLGFHSIICHEKLTIICLENLSYSQFTVMELMMAGRWADADSAVKYVEESEGKKASVEKLLVQQVSKQVSRQVSTYRMSMPESELGTVEDRASMEVLASIPKNYFV